MLAAKVTDEFFISGMESDVPKFADKLLKAFKVGKMAIGNSFKFNCCEGTDVKDGTTLPMIFYMYKLNPVPMNAGINSEVEDKATKVE